MGLVTLASTGAIATSGTTRIDGAGGGTFTSVFSTGNIDVGGTAILLNASTGAISGALAFGTNEVGTSGTFKVSGTSVVGAQGAAVGDADGTLASATSQLNSLLARCRAHGLIAT